MCGVPDPSSVWLDNESMCMMVVCLHRTVHHHQPGGAHTGELLTGAVARVE